MGAKNRRTGAKKKTAAKKKDRKKPAQERSASDQIKAAREAAQKEMQVRAEKCGREVDAILRKYDCYIAAFPEFRHSPTEDGSCNIGAVATIMARNTKEN